MGLPVVRLAGCFGLSALCADALDFSTNAFVVHAHLLQPTPSDLRGAGSMSHRLLFASHVFFLVDSRHFVVWRLLPRGSRSNTPPEETGGATSLPCECAVGLQVRPFQSARPA